MKRVNPLTNVETARWDNENYGKCPVCEQSGMETTMEVARIGTLPVYVCQEHNVCLPVEDTNPEYQK